MACGKTNDSSCSIDENSTNGWDSDKIRDQITLGNICNDGKRITWNNSYELLKEFVKTAFTQHGKWCSPGGGSKRFDSSISDFKLAWYPGKLNTLSFNGKVGMEAKKYLINLCCSLTLKATDIHEQFDNGAEERECMESMIIDIEILRSRVSSMQAAIISMENPKTAELRSEVAQLRDELEEEKVKNVSLDLQVKLLKDEIAKIKSSSQNIHVKTVDAFVSVDTTQSELFSEDNGMNSSDVIEITPVVVDKTSQKDKSQKINPGVFNEHIKTVDAFVSVDTTQSELISEDNRMNSSDVIEVTPVVVDKTSQKDKSQKINRGAFNEQLNPL